MQKLKTVFRCNLKIETRAMVCCVILLIIMIRSISNGYRIGVYDFADIMFIAQLGNILCDIAVLLFFVILGVTMLQQMKQKLPVYVTYAKCCKVDDFAPKYAPPALTFCTEVPYGLMTVREHTTEMPTRDVDDKVTIAVTGVYANMISVAHVYDKNEVVACKQIAQDFWEFRTYVQATVVGQLSNRVSKLLQICLFIALSCLYIVMTICDLTQNTVINRAICIGLYVLLFFAPYVTVRVYTHIKQLFYIYTRK